MTGERRSATMELRWADKESPQRQVLDFALKGGPWDEVLEEVLSTGDDGSLDSLLETIAAYFYASQLRGWRTQSDMVGLESALRGLQAHKPLDAIRLQSGYKHNMDLISELINVSRAVQRVMPFPEPGVQPTVATAITVLNGEIAALTANNYYDPKGNRLHHLGQRIADATSNNLSETDLEERRRVVQQHLSLASHAPMRFVDGDVVRAALADFQARHDAWAEPTEDGKPTAEAMFVRELTGANGQRPRSLHEIIAVDVPVKDAAAIELEVIAYLEAFLDGSQPTAAAGPTPPKPRRAAKRAAAVAPVPVTQPEIGPETEVDAAEADASSADQDEPEVVATDPVVAKPSIASLMARIAGAGMGSRARAAEVPEVVDFADVKDDEEDQSEELDESGGDDFEEYTDDDEEEDLVPAAGEYGFDVPDEEILRDIQADEEFGIAGEDGEDAVDSVEEAVIDLEGVKLDVDNLLSDDELKFEQRPVRTMGWARGTTSQWRPTAPREPGVRDVAQVTQLSFNDKGLPTGDTRGAYVPPSTIKPIRRVSEVAPLPRVEIADHAEYLQGPLPEYLDGMTDAAVLFGELLRLADIEKKFRQAAEQYLLGQKLPTSMFEQDDIRLGIVGLQGLFKQFETTLSEADRMSQHHKNVAAELQHMADMRFKEATADRVSLELLKTMKYVLAYLQPSPRETKRQRAAKSS